MSRWIAVLVISSVVALAASAAAQTPEPPAPPGTPPDVVLSPSGGMVRGTIIESVPGQYVVIALPTGETRRIDWAQVSYAGPAEGAPRAATVQSPPQYGQYGSAATPSGPAPVEPGGLRLRFESPQDGISLHRVTGSATATAWGGGGAIALRAYSFERLCTAPCDLTLEPGSYHLALSVGTGGEVPAQVFDLSRDGTLYGQYLDRTGLRVAGWLTLILGSLAGAAMMTVPILTTNSLETDDWLGWLIAGGVVVVVSDVIGLILAFQQDGAVIRFD